LIAGHGQSRLGDLLHQDGRGQIELLGIIGEHVIEPARKLGLLARERDRIDQQVSGVARSGIGEHPLVRAVDPGELALER
jgi:hypothetical protein